MTILHLMKAWGFLVIYHNQVIKEEDFSLVRCLFLGLVDVRHLEESTAANQSSVRDRENLGRQKRKREGRS